jgi:malonyl-CoA/methylmalonyl-CoA synthetase
MNLYAMMEQTRPNDADRLVLETKAGTRFLWRDLDQLTAQCANFMTTTLGLSKGDRVAVQVEKSPANLWLYLGCIRAGLIYLPMNTAYMPDELDFLLGNAEPGLVVCRPESLEMVSGIAHQHKVRHVLTMSAEGSGTFMDGASAVPKAFSTLPCADDDIAAILYTSGTTGRPKGAMLSHSNLFSNTLDLIKSWGMSETDVLLHALPIFHTHGLFVASNTALFSGASMLWLPKFDYATVMRLLPRATMFMGVPTYYTRLLAGEEFGKEVCRNMRLFISGSAPLLAETHKAFEHRTGLAILERYGMTETGMNTSNPLAGERRPGTVGFPLPGVEVRLEGGSEVGVIQVKGNNVFKGYWRNPEKTAEDFTADGWFVTGDLGQISADGYVSIVGRARDMIISGGFNVYPKEVEDVIDRIPGVVESAVVGIPHPDFGEAVAAIIVASDKGLDEAAIIAATKARIANYKVPKAVKFVAELPRNTMGKVQKTVLRQMFTEAG